MSQRDSGYERQERDLYETPAWVTEALLPHLPECRTIWEPAAGSGKMSRVLEGFAGTVISSDLAGGQDFLAADGFDGTRSSPILLMSWPPSLSNMHCP